MSSSYSPTLFGAVGRVLGPVDLAAIPIGSYEPRWHLHLQHTDPEGAVRMAMQLNAKKSVGVHWGTWLMSDEACTSAFENWAEMRADERQTISHQLTSRLPGIGWR